LGLYALDYCANSIIYQLLLALLRALLQLLLLLQLVLIPLLLLLLLRTSQEAPVHTISDMDPYSLHPARTSSDNNNSNTSSNTSSSSTLARHRAHTTASAAAAAAAAGAPIAQQGSTLDCSHSRHKCVLILLVVRSNVGKPSQRPSERLLLLARKSVLEEERCYYYTATYGPYLQYYIYGRSEQQPYYRVSHDTVGLRTLLVHTEREMALSS
jgi:hypothetical protein